MYLRGIRIVLAVAVIQLLSLMQFAQSLCPSPGPCEVGPTLSLFEAVSISWVGTKQDASGACIGSEWSITATVGPYFMCSTIFGYPYVNAISQTTGQQVVVWAGPACQPFGGPTYVKSFVLPYSGFPPNSVVHFDALVETGGGSCICIPDVSSGTVPQGIVATTKSLGCGGSLGVHTVSMDVEKHKLTSTLQTTATLVALLTSIAPTQVSIYGTPTCIGFPFFATLGLGIVPIHGEASLTFAVPPSLMNQTWYLQWLSLIPGIPTPIVESSDTIRVRFGPCE